MSGLATQPARASGEFTIGLPIPGTSTVAHLEENVGAALIELTPDQSQQLHAAI